LQKQGIPETDLQTTSGSLKNLSWKKPSKRAMISFLVVLISVIVVITALFSNPYKANLSSNSDGNSMAFIEAGAFLMGNDDGADDQKPAHEVYLDSYWIDTFEVTNKEYQVFIEETGHTPPTNWKDGQYVPGREHHPVIGITWYDAKQFCEWNGAKRLPTEAEWEKAARGTDGRVWPWSGGWIDGSANTLEAKVGSTTPVGTYPKDKSPYGVMDMAGNVQEWVDDWYQEDYYSRAVSQNPLGPISETNKAKVVRGGAYWLGKELATAYSRSGIYPPDYPFPIKDDFSSPTPIGFRCVCDDCN
jgi:iron(II)-dependent oxidoreductase